MVSIHEFVIITQMKCISNGSVQIKSTRPFPNSNGEHDYFSEHGVLLSGPNILVTGSGMFFVCMTWALIDGAEWFYAYGPKSNYADAYNVLQSMLYGVGQSGWLTYQGEFYNFQLRHQLTIKLPEAEANAWLALQ
jgi:hypothetical protein